MFISTQVICFAVAVWSRLECWLRQRAPAVSLRNGVLPYAHVAQTAGLHLLALLVGLAVALQLTGAAIMDGAAVSNPLYATIGEPLAWCALLTLVVAALLCLWDEPYASATRYHLYAAGLLAIGLVLQALPLTPRNGWYPPLVLGGYVLAVTALGRLHERSPVLQRLLPPIAPDRRCDWLFGCQSFLGSVVAVLSVAVTFGFAGSVHGLAGPLACLGACLTWELVAGVWPRVLSAATDPPYGGDLPRYVTLLLGVLVMLEIPWAITDPTIAGRWLQHIGAAWPW